MTIEELERDLKIAQNTISRITEEIEKLKEADNEILWQPKNGEEYWYVYHSFIMEKYHIISDYSRGERNIRVAFQTAKQAQKACDYLNRIMPMLKLAIENPDDSKLKLSFSCYGGEFGFFIESESQKIKLVMKKLWEQGKQNEDSQG